ncbi:MAG: hypothetical protein JWM63_2898 [Gammaproteobacteria bacterium]|jgi:hypothetical protein|nr:hypothetical protein [Gammaproteobacteria bacterium]
MGASPTGTRSFPAINNLAVELTPITGGIGSTRLDVLEAGAGFLLLTGSGGRECERSTGERVRTS